jgi:glycine oxidase
VTGGAKTKPDVAIVGAGLLGRLLAWRAALSGLRVAVYDANDRTGSRATAWVAAGMVAPQVEAVDTEPIVVALGRRSLALWPEWLPALPAPVHYRASGALLVWRYTDAAEARRFEAVLKSRDPHSSYMRLDAQQTATQEPLLKGRFREALYLPGEAHIDNRQLLPALADALDELGVDCNWNTAIDDTHRPDAALVVDCRGKRAKSRWKEVRGVRGEILRLHAPGIELQHMIRLLHPRQSIYLVGRPGGKIVVGATTVESDDDSPVSVLGALELLSAAYAVLPELGEARILELNSDCRPALPDNLPAVRYSAANRLLEINGLYRHGFLLSPAIVEEAMSLIPQLLAEPEAAPAATTQWPSLYAREESLV